MRIFRGITIHEISALIVMVAAEYNKKEIAAQVPENNKASVSQNIKIDITDQAELEKGEDYL